MNIWIYQLCIIFISLYQFVEGSDHIKHNHPNVWHHTRKINYVELGNNNKINNVTTYQFAEFVIMFNAPLYVMNPLLSSRKKYLVNETNIDQYLKNSIELKCSNGHHYHLCSWNKSSTYWEQPNDCLLAINSIDNPMREVWDGYRDISHPHALETSILRLMLMLQHSSVSSKIKTSVLLKESDLESCSLNYKAFSERTNNLNRSINNSSSTQTNRNGILTLPNRKELIFKNVRIESSKEECCLEHTIVNVNANDKRFWTSHLKMNQSVPTQFINLGADAKMMPLIMKPAVEGIIKPAMETSIEYIAQELAPIFTNQLNREVVDEVVPDVNVMLVEVLLANLTNILDDSITESLTKSLALAFTRALGPYLSNQITLELAPIYHAALDKELDAKINKRLEQYLPEVLDRVVSLTLLQGLTRSVTKALVPTLVHTVAHSRRENAWCRDCYYYGKRCSFCHLSRESMYYVSYHATYYSDYFTDYYTDYYTLALQWLDATLYPDFDGEAFGGLHGDNGYGEDWKGGVGFATSASMDGGNLYGGKYFKLFYGRGGSSFSDGMGGGDGGGGDGGGGGGGGGSSSSSSEASYESSMGSELTSIEKKRFHTEISEASSSHTYYYERGATDDDMNKLKEWVENKKDEMEEEKQKFLEKQKQSVSMISEKEKDDRRRYTTPRPFLRSNIAAIKNTTQVLANSTKNNNNNNNNNDLDINLGAGDKW